MEQLTYEHLLTTVIVVIVLLGGYNTFMGAIKTHREEKRLRESPVKELEERIDRHDDLLKKDKDRLDEHERQLTQIGIESRIMLRGVRALLSHEVNGNSTEKLEKSMAEIDEYLISQK